MKLKQIGESDGYKKSDTPSLTIYEKLGKLSLNGSACELLKLKAGDSILMFFDEDDPKNYYIEKAKSKFLLKGNKGYSLTFNSIAFARDLVEKKELKALPNEKVIRILIAGQPTIIGEKGNQRTLYGLL